MKMILLVIAVASTCLAISHVFAVEQFRDYYSEPALHPFKESLNEKWCQSKVFSNIDQKTMRTTTWNNYFIEKWGH